MATKDLAHNIRVRQVGENDINTTTLTGDTIDMQGFESLAVVFDVGESDDTLSGSVLWTLTLTESDSSGSGYTTVAAADVDVINNGTESAASANSVVIDAAAEDDVVVVMGYRGSKRYVKGVATVTGTHTNGTPLGIVAVQGNGHIMPNV